jgi:hypothetical protein
LPVSGARVALHGPAPESATTSASGAFRFERLPPGEYNLTAIKPGYLDSNKGSVHYAVSLKAGAVTENASLALAPLGALEGAVLDEDGKPLSGVYVTVAGLSVSTAKDGRFAFEDLVPDSYQIAVGVPHAVRSATLSRDPSTGEFYGYGPAQFYPGAADPRLAIPVQVSAGARLRNLDLRLRRTHLVEFAGLLVDATSREPISGVEVELIGSVPGTPDPLWRKHPASADGSFRFSLLEPGSYKLAVYRAGLSPLPYIVPVALGKTGADDMRIAVPPLTTLQGRIQVGDPKIRWFGAPRVVLRYLNGTTLQCAIQTNVAFECSEVPPGEFFLDVQGNLGMTSNRTRLSVKEIRFGAQDGLHRPITVAENGNPPIEITLTDEPSGVAGKVIDEASKTSNYLVMALRLSPRATATATVGPPDFQIPDLGPGEYEISAYRTGSQRDLLGPRTGCAESVKVTVVEGALKYITLRPCPAQ